MLGGSCIYCGYNRCQRALHFHHVDPEKKKLNMATAPWKTAKKELKKCVILCANCHAEIHAGMKFLPKQSASVYDVVFQ